VKGLAVALVAAVVLVPAAAAKSHHPGLNLARVPLPKARLGAAAAGLQLNEGSGAQTDAGAVSGYELDYGSLFLANPGLDEVETSVNAYKTARAARHALTKSKQQFVGSSAVFANLSRLELTVTAGLLSVPAIGHTHWAAIETFSVANEVSAYVVAVELRDGKYLLDSIAAAGSQKQAESFAAAKARALDKRLHLALKGRLHGHAVAAPKYRKPGPPAKGTDPATAVLQTSDLPGSVIDDKEYTNSFDVDLSTYEVSFHPAGSFASVDQTVSLMPSANSAAFVAAFIGAIEVGVISSSGTGTAVDVSAAGDDAQAEIVSGTTINIAVVTLHSGSVADTVFAESSTTIDPTAVQTLAQAAATRLDAALP
jgi:hypothetical protein